IEETGYRSFPQENREKTPQIREPQEALGHFRHAPEGGQRRQGNHSGQSPASRNQLARHLRSQGPRLTAAIGALHWSLTTAFTTPSWPKPRNGFRWSRF